jgi:AcrR family transcriptional regulator
MVLSHQPNKEVNYTPFPAVSLQETYATFWTGVQKRRIEIMETAAPLASDAESEPTRASDPRPARTRAAILAAVERLPDLAPSQVTVSAIARDAGVSRSVFYIHFSGLEELLSAVLTQTAMSDESDLDPTDNRMSPRQATVASLTQLVHHVEARAAFYTAALEWKTTFGVHDVTVTGYARRIRELTASIRRSSPHGSIPPEETTDLAATFVAGGLSAALTAWLRTNRATPSTSLVEELLGSLPAWLVTDEITPTDPRIS